ncbi:conserved oligomeric Golgi complex subunit 8-like [Mercenaria mercenaria]|uniref:conserved oligomeric Golgi complex subunit 8-like n=1 Tax=Mercenaria mercenaria TaxID=6596 RepID=UPI00234F996C|nr:conserved oligomeric Golgi complex subunit 8-like [Mercenaria mercenaria]
MESIDVEEESVLTAIFKDSFPDSWQSDPNFVQYLSELSSYGVEKLAQEPDRLSEEKTQILEETQNLAFQNYKTFIQTAECSREIFEDFQIIEQHVEGLLEKLPEFSEQCNQVLKKAQDITSSRRMNSLTLQRHTQLLEILELPQLMDTCVRNCYYDEALELASHVKRLEKKHSGIPVVANIVNEVKMSTQLMLNQLIQQLRTNVQLPACLRVIGYLRRMDVFTEVELRIKFLQARDSWFQGILEAVPKEDAYTHITKSIEASRVNLFDIITQYRAIFSDEDPLLSTSKDESLNEGALFHTWIVQKVSQFLAILEEDLARGVGGRLDSILGQCMYFGLSFSRVGADFRGLLTPIFQQAALNGLLLALQEANKRFEDSMRCYSLLSATSTMGGLPYNAATQSGQLYPPTILLDFYPLAAYCNDVLTALNELRLCAPVALVTEVSNALHNSFVNVNKIILAFHRAEETTFDRKEKERFDEFCSAYAHSLVPYINKCLQALYPQTQLAQILGVTVSELNKMGGLGQVNIKSALQSISHLVPEVEAEPVTVPVTEVESRHEIQNTIPEVPSDQSDVLSETVADNNQPEAVLQNLSTNNQSETSTENVFSEMSQSQDKVIENEPETDLTEGKGSHEVKFSLSDTEGEAELEKDIMSTNIEDVVPDTEENLDIEHDLSALAADVLGTKSEEKTD